MRYMYNLCKLKNKLQKFVHKFSSIINLNENRKFLELFMYII